MKPLRQGMGWRICHMPIGVRSALSIERAQRTDWVKRGSIREVSLDLLIDDQTGYFHVAPVGRANFIWLIVQELMNFWWAVGVFSNHLQDNKTNRENADHCSPQPRTHYKIEYFKAWRPLTSVREHSWQGEKACRKFHWRCAVKPWHQGRIRSCTLDLGSKTCQWVLNRFQPIKGATPCELVYGKSYKGLLAEWMSS